VPPPSRFSRYADEHSRGIPPVELNDEYHNITVVILYIVKIVLIYEMIVLLNVTTVMFYVTIVMFNTTNMMIYVTIVHLYVTIGFSLSLWGRAGRLGASSSLYIMGRYRPRIC
jgi:hypothetical protein